MNRLAAFTLLLALSTAPLPASGKTPKSPKAAAFLSLLLPGAGELYAGGGRSARFFFTTEGLSWTGLFAFRVLNSAREATFKSFAAVHAGAQTRDKPNSYFDELVNFNSIYARNARARYTDGELADLRPETPENIWEWDSETSRKKFRNLRSRATWARTRGLLFIGALVFNRFASTINAAHIARKTQPPPVEVDIAPRPDGGLQTRLQIRF